MKIAVLVKHVPDTETKIVINSEKTGIDDSHVKYVMNPNDEFAVEEALKIGGETTAVSMGPERAVEVIRTALAMGIGKAIHVDTKGIWYDSFATATVLAKILKEGSYDLILCGKQAIDGDNAQVVPMIAEMMGIAQVMPIEKVEVQGDKLRVTRRIGGGSKEIYEPKLPVILGAEKGLNIPRYASLPGIMKAKSKPVEKKSAEDFLKGINNLVVFQNYALPPEKQGGRKIEGEAAWQAKELIRLLREEAKVL